MVRKLKDENLLRHEAEFKKFVASRGESYHISSGTLDLTTLLVRAYDLISAYDLDKGLKYKIYKVLVIEDESFDIETDPLRDALYHSLVHVHEQKSEEASYLWNEEIFNYFNEIAPDGYVFGSHEGDGSLIGWQKVEENGN